MATMTTALMHLQCSWDTQQQLPYNRNAPRKVKVKPPVSVSSATVSQSTTTTASSSARAEKVDIYKLFEFHNESPKQVWETVESEESVYVSSKAWLPSPPKVQKPRSTYNAASMAYIGDCIYELYARRHFLAPVLNVDEYNDRVTAVVRCEAQDALLQKLLSDDFLSENERDILRWGKNISSAKTRSKKRAGVAVYNRASSLEALIGYLYLTDPKRLEDVMQKLGFSVDASNQSIIDVVNREVQDLKQKKVK
ncbi:hypothetical protein V2J09_005317 [Rumex salicifolius]